MLVVDGAAHFSEPKYLCVALQLELVTPRNTKEFERSSDSAQYTQSQTLISERQRDAAFLLTASTDRSWSAV